jgi:hypothetical protein
MGRGGEGVHGACLGSLCLVPPSNSDHNLDHIVVLCALLLRLQVTLRRESCAHSCWIALACTHR